MKKKSDQKPEWVPENAGDAFATKIVPGKITNYNAHTRSTTIAHKRSSVLSVEEYVQGVLRGDRTILGRAITLIESNSPRHRETAEQVLHQLLPHSGKSIRIGISGVPGAGKSTFIEAFGCYLTGRGHRVAVLAVDPSSTVTRGSILGDKTRMEKLAREPNCFIRPSPSGGTLGGVARKSRETMLICEAAGYDCLLIETVGVGQNEITVRSMVDFFLLLMIPGAGDELQGIKKGVMEIADAIIVNKADGDNIPRALAAQREYRNALHYLSRATRDWETPVMTCSALLGTGIAEIWEMIESFHRLITQNHVFTERRQDQALAWLEALVEEQLKDHFYNHPAVKKILSELRHQIVQDKILPTAAAEMLLHAYRSERPNCSTIKTET